MANIDTTRHIRVLDAELEEPEEGQAPKRRFPAVDFGAPYHWLLHKLKIFMPRRLFARSLIIIITPVVLTQIVVTYIFFERHWDIVTSRLSESVAGDIALLIDIYESFPSGNNIEQLKVVAKRTTGFSIEIVPNDHIPTSSERRSPFPLVDKTLRQALEKKLNTDFWFDFTRYSEHVDIRIQLGDSVMYIYPPVDRVMATNGHIFLLWMIGTAGVLLTVAIIFLRNQVRPIQRLAVAAANFGKGQDLEVFKPTGATEVRRAAEAFIEMRKRIKRHIEQRTMLLAGVSHDLKTPITRMKLELEMMEPGESVDAMRHDLNDMEHMLDEYLTFARGQGSEAPAPVDIGYLTEEVVQGFERGGHSIGFDAKGNVVALVRRNGLKRCLTNIIENAARYADRVAVRVERRGGAIYVIVDDDGPGIDPTQLDDVFKPFMRLDKSRNLDTGGVGLGLAIARDVARGHGGDIALSESPFGGLRAVITLPV